MQWMGTARLLFQCSCVKLLCGMLALLPCLREVPVWGGVCGLGDGGKFGNDWMSAAPW